MLTGYKNSNNGNNSIENGNRNHIVYGGIVVESIVVPRPFSLRDLGWFYVSSMNSL